MAALAGAMLAGCDREHTVPPVPPRAVKLEAVGMTAASDATRFVATVRQEQRADLAFEGGGRIESMSVDVGDRVRRGQVLARLDQTPIQLKLRQAQAQLRAAAAQWRERDSQWRQRQAMFADGSASRATLTSAETALDAAASQRQTAEADLALIQRASRQSEIRAPFDGAVVARLAQPQGDTSAGQPVLQLEGIGRLQAVAMLPAEVANRLRPGAVVRARRTGTSELLSLRLRSVSSRLDAGGSAQAILDLQESATEIRSGDSVSLDLLEAPTGALTVPLSAVVADARGANAAVFVYQATAGRVTRRPVMLGPISGERFAVKAGLKPGDQVVAAGASFLTDGQQVQPLAVESRLAAGGPQ